MSHPRRPAQVLLVGLCLCKATMGFVPTGYNGRSTCWAPERTTVWNSGSDHIEESIVRASEASRRQVEMSAGGKGLGRREQLAIGSALAGSAPWILGGGLGQQQSQSAWAVESAVGKPLCNDGISHLRDPKSGKEVFLIGTAHISNASAQLVRETIRRVVPSTVMLELDESRVGRVSKPSKAAAVPAGSASSGPSSESPEASARGPMNAPPFPQFQERAAPPPVLATAPVPNSNKVNFLQMALREVTKTGSGFRDNLLGLGAIVIGRVISGLYATLDKMGFVSGQEFIVAIDEARKVGADILLGDRDVKVTLRRLSEALSESDLNKVMAAESPRDSPAVKLLAQRNISIATEDAAQIAVAVEALKDRATVRVLMATMQQDLPQVYNAMIRERDEYMANSLLGSPSTRILGVVGLAHLDGIERYLSAAGFKIVDDCQ